MRNYVYYISLVLLGLTSTNLSAANYIYNGASWSPSNPFVSGHLLSGDNAIINGSFTISANTFIDAGATFTINATVNMSGSKNLTNNGTMIISSGGTYTCSGNSNYYNNGLLIVNGTLDGNGNFDFNNTSTIIGTGTIDLGNNAASNAVNTGTINGCTIGCLGTNGTTDLGTLPGAPPTDGLNEVWYISSTDPIPVLNCSDRLWVLAEMTLNQNVSTGGLITAFPITVNSTYSLTVCQEITNNSSIVIESGASLNQTALTNDNNGTGSYTVRQSGGQTSSSLYNIWSSPITNALTKNPNVVIGTEVFSGTNPCDLYVVDASTQTWTFDFDPSETYTCLTNSGVSFSGYVTQDGTADGYMDVARGYYAVGNGSAKEFVGTVNNGDVSIPIFANNLPIPTGWGQSNLNLVGNPYPSGLDAATFFTDNSGSITDALYFWDGSNYVSWNVSGASIPANPNIGVGQGFWVIATSNTNLNFSNSQRSNTNNQFFKTEKANTNHSVWLEINTPSKEKGNILVGYNDAATDGMDRLYDGHYLPGNPNVKLTSLINNDEFIIQSFSSLLEGETKSISLNVFTAETGLHNIQSLKTENIPSNVTIYLRDKYNRVLHDFSNGNYVVYLEGNQEYSNRFELVFSSGDLSTNIDEINSSNFNLLNVGGEITLTNNEGIEGDIMVVDVTGKVVWSQSNVNTNQVSIDLNIASSGVYFVTVIKNNSRLYSNKIVRL